MEPITFYHNPYSRGAIAHWALEESEVPYEIKLLSFDKKEHKSPEFLKLNPMGKIPTILHKNVVITEAAAICAYLGDITQVKSLAPATVDSARGTYYRWLFFGAGCIEPAAIDRAFNRPMPDKPGTLGYGSYEDTLDTLEFALSTGPYLLGDQFTMADVYVGAQIDWGIQFKTIEARPRFVEYQKAIQDRPAWHRFQEKNKELIAQLG